MAIQLLDIEEYVINRLKEIAPDVNPAPGSGVRDLLISPLSAILQPLANEIHRVKKSQSLVNAGSLSDQQSPSADSHRGSEHPPRRSAPGRHRWDCGRASRRGGPGPAAGRGDS